MSRSHCKYFHKNTNFEMGYHNGCLIRSISQSSVIESISENLKETGRTAASGYF